MGFFFGAEILWLLFIAFFIYLMLSTNTEFHIRYKRLGVFVLKTIVFADIGLVINFLAVLFTGQPIAYGPVDNGIAVVEVEEMIVVGAICSFILYWLGNYVYPDWLKYWTY